MFRTPSLFLTLAVCALRAAESPVVELTYSGDQQVLAALDRELQSAGRDPARLAAVEKRLLTDLARRDATFAGRQAIAQRLALVMNAAPDPKSAAAKAFSAMLIDPRDCDLARLALQPVPGATIDGMIVAALPKATGRAQLGLIDSLAVRRTQLAVTPLGNLLRNSDAAVAAAAARALGEIGTVAALQALRNAPATIGAAPRLAAAGHLGGSDGLDELKALRDDAGIPAAVRDAAFRLSLDRDPQNAASQIVSALSNGSATRKQVALEAISASTAPNLVSTLANKLPAFDPITQAAVVTAFSRRPDRAQIETGLVVQMTGHDNAAVRAAAITALGFLTGTKSIVTSLATLAANGDRSDEAKLARASLVRLNGPEVSAAIVAGAENAPAPLRVVYLEQLALRNQTESLPLLLKARSDSDAAVRLAAVAALGDIAPLSEQRALLEWTLAAHDEAEQSRALRSLLNVILRDPATETRGQVLFEALPKANPDAALRLLPGLGRIGGRRAADVAAQMATREDEKIAEAAVSALTRWPDASAVPALATVAEKGSASGPRDSARSALLRALERNRDPWTPAFTDAIARVLPTSRDTAERIKFIRLLHRANDAAALKLAGTLKSDPALAGAGATAAEVIRANQAGTPKFRASGGASNLSNVMDRKTSTRWNVPTDGDEWFEIDFRVSRPLQSLTLDQTGRGAEFPERYEVYVTDKVDSPGPVRVSGEGQQNKTVVDFPPNTRGRYVIVKNVAERKDSQWSIVELYVE